MESIFKRLLNAGIGVASKTTRFAEDVINDLVNKGKLPEDEGRKIIQDLGREGEEQRQIFESELNAYIERAMQQMDVPTRKDFNRLEERIAILERSQPGATQLGNIPA